MENFVGNAKIVSEIDNIITSQNIGHAYLFYGPDGVGKQILAKSFASRIFNSETSLESIPDYYYIEPEDNLIKVDDIRRLGDEIILKPISSDRKVCIINDADYMNESAQNTLLKVLEEPPSYASNKEKIINTIKSRCTILNFDKLKAEELKMIFAKDTIDDGLITFSNGSASKYLKLKDSNYIDNLLILENVIDSKDLLELNRAFTKLKQISTIKEDIFDILDLLIIKLGSNLLDDSNKNVYKIEAVEEVRNNLTRNANMDASLDYLMIKLYEINNSK